MTKIVLIAVLICLSAFFSATETAFSSVNRIRLKNYAEQGNKKAKKAYSIVMKFDKALTAILIGNNIVNIASASLATIVFTEKFGSESVGLATVVMTIIVLIFGEIIPKSLAKENAEKFSLWVAPILSVIMFIFTPFTLLFVALKNAVTKRVDKGGKDDPSVTEEELKYIIDEIEDQGVLEEQESDLVKSALEFDEITINEILIPRVNIVGVNINENVEEIKKIFFKERYSRLPVYDKTMDNIVGVINYKDFMEMYISGGKSIKSIIQKPFCISEHKKISDILKEMQRSKNHIAIVIDQYGGTEGIVTLEDIIEELVGEIYDENDDDPPQFTVINDNTYMVSGELSLNDLLEQLDITDYEFDTECNSVGGYVMELLSHIASCGEVVSHDMFTFRVVKTDEQRILKVQLTVERSDKQEEKED